jgi:hypothetical protein
MKIAILSVCTIGLALASHGLKAQTTVVPQAPTVRFDTVPSTALLKYAALEVGIEPDSESGSRAVRPRVIAKTVEIQMGDNVLVADEAQIQYRANGDFDVVELRGTVRLKAKLRVN